MTEKEWMQYTETMYIPSARKQRLLLCAICRRVLYVSADKKCHEAIEIAERYADNDATIEEIQVAVNNVRAVFRAAMEAVGKAADQSEQEAANWVRAARHSGKPNDLIALCCTACVCEFPLWQRGDTHAIKNRTRLALVNSAEALLFWESKDELEAVRAQQMIMRDIQFPVDLPFESAWRTPTVLALAQAAYDNRSLPAGTLDNTRLGILSDGLEDACCDNSDLLNHLRQPGQHWRGCWALDLVLGKE